MYESFFICITITVIIFRIWDVLELVIAQFCKVLQTFKKTAIEELESNFGVLCKFFV